eukprot:SAG31_NODE_135_length_23206_cov_25.707967_3_plen_80_part_00
MNWRLLVHSPGLHRAPNNSQQGRERGLLPRLEGRGEGFALESVDPTVDRLTECMRKAYCQHVANMRANRSIIFLVNFLC